MELKAIAPKDVFIRIVEANIKVHLPDEYSGSQVEIKEVHKATETYTALLVQNPSRPMTPAVNLDAFYNMYRENGNISEILDDMAEIITMDIPNGYSNLPDLTKFENVEDKLFVRLVSGEGKEELKAAVPHRFVEDMLLTYCIHLQDATVTINNELLKGYGLTEQELHDKALENSQKIFPAEVGDLGTMLGTGNDNLTIVTNSTHFCGASAILYPHVLDDIAQGSRIYLLPSSMHEILVCDSTSDPEELKKIVVSANATVVEPEDQLSDHVYAYENGELKIVA